MRQQEKKDILLLIPFLLSGLSACATNDPWERPNRVVYALNKEVDKMILKPAAQVYYKIVPEPVNVSITNFFNNVSDIPIFTNDLLQGKVKQAGSDAGRVLLNTSVGFFGFFDPATEYGLQKNNEDFGQTLGYWGIGSGPYLVLPLIGPSSLRDAPGMVVDWLFKPQLYIEDIPTRNAVYGLTVIGVIDSRADLLSAEQILEAAAVDEYNFMRNAYLQRRESLVHDGEPPVEQAIDDAELFN